jgi:hypothetical protein
MGLPAGQQRALDTIEEALGTAEPHLAAMYAIFTRLTGNEARPQREQLPCGRGWRAWRARLRYARADRGARDARCRRLSEPAGLMAIRHAGARGGPPFPRVLMLGQLMAILAMLGLLIGITATMRPAACASALTARHAAAHLAAATCRPLTSAGK